MWKREETGPTEIVANDFACRDRSASVALAIQSRVEGEKLDRLRRDLALGPRGRLQLWGSRLLAMVAVSELMGRGWG